jgi:hypothetical protein
MVGHLIILVTICASLSGETACRVVEVPTDLLDPVECASEAEEEANAALNLAVFHAISGGVYIESVDAVCTGTAM